MFNTEKDNERLVLISINDDMNELAMLAETAGAEVVGYMSQPLDAPHCGHYFGKGKVEELKEYAASVGATGILCDDELTSAQFKNLGQILDLTVLDRTLVILDIFAKRAVSAEGKAQVELAQLRYRSSRLTGLGTGLSRQGGGVGGARGLGIGARGPGEKKLEIDRRHIRSRVAQLTAELKEIETNRAVLREKRKRDGIPVIALVGYTNAGKSTLLNTLTSAGVLEEDKLFATLETTTRRLELPGGTEVLLSDTVGFIHKLPHHLIQAFRATLEELRYADILLHVVDASNPEYASQIAVVQGTLSELQCAGKPMVTAYNKMDILNHTPGEAADYEKRTPSGHLETEYDVAKHQRGTEISVRISAKTGENLTELLTACETVIQNMRKKIRVLIPYTEGNLVSLIHDRCELISEEHTERGTLIEAYAGDEIYGYLREYIEN